MSAPTRDHLGEAARAGRDVLSTALRTWGETMQTMMAMPGGRNGGARPDRLTDAWFDVAEEALTAQREFTKAVLSMGEPALAAMTGAAQRTMEAAEQYTHAATEAGGEASSATARPRRDHGTSG